MRTALYMPALSMVRCNPKIREMYKRLKEKGKPSHLAITAIMRKVVITLNTMIKNNTKWVDKAIES